MTRLLRRPTGWASWIVLLVAIVIVLANHADRRGVSHAYEAAAHRFLDGEPLYTEGYKGFLYPPQSAMAYVPFLYPNEVAGSFLWRTLGLALLTSGLFRLLQRLRSTTAPAGPSRFTIASLLLIPVTISSLRNGQSNLHMAGLLLHATVAWMDRKRFAPAAWMLAGLVAKPLTFVWALLAGATGHKLLLGFVAAWIVFTLLPFVHPEPGYAADQIHAFVEKSKASSDPGDHVYANLEGILHKAGVPVPHPARRPIQIVAALLTLGLALWAKRRVDARAFPFVVYTLAALYLMLFNPRNESNSFVILGPAVGVLAALAWTTNARRDAWLLTVIAIAWGCDNYGRWLHEPTDRWFKPAAAIVFLVYLLRRVSATPNRPLLPFDRENPHETDSISA